MLVKQTEWIKFTKPESIELVWYRRILLHLTLIEWIGERVAMVCIDLILKAWSTVSQAAWINLIHQAWTTVSQAAWIN